MEYRVVGGPLESVPLFQANIPGYALDDAAEVPTMKWVGGVTVYTLVGGPWESGRLPFLPAGYERHPDNVETAVWTMKSLSYNIGYPVDKLYPTLAERYCSACGVLSRPRPANELTLFIHPVRGTGGHYRLYCPSHVPTAEWGYAREDQRKLCPSCFTLIPLSGVCDFCA